MINIYSKNKMGYYSQLDIEIQNQRWLHNTVLTELLHNTVLTELLDYMRNKTEEDRNKESGLASTLRTIALERRNQKRTPSRTGMESMR